MAYLPVQHVSAKSADGYSVTTAAADFTGVDFIVLIFSNYVGTDFAPVLSDLSGNNYNKLTAQTAGNVVGTLAWFQAPVVSASMTFKVQTNGSALNFAYPSICVLGFSGSTATPLDDQRGAHATGVTSLQPGSYTPGFANELILTGMAWEGSATATVDGGSPTEQQNWTSGLDFGTAISYSIQTSITTVNPNWGRTSSGSTVALLAGFKAAAAAATVRQLAALGVG